MAETNLRCALVIGDGDLGVLVESWFSRVVLLVVVLAVVVPTLLRHRQTRPAGNTL